MGMKYSILGFNYPKGAYLADKQTDNLFFAIIYFIQFSFKYDGVDLYKRSN